MGRFDELKALIDENITTNGQQEITGAVLNSTLDSIVDATDTELTELEKTFSSEWAENIGDLISSKMSSFILDIKATSTIPFKSVDVYYLRVEDGVAKLNVRCIANNSSSSAISFSISLPLSDTPIRQSITRGNLYSNVNNEITIDICYHTNGLADVGYTGETYYTLVNVSLDGNHYIDYGSSEFNLLYSALVPKQWIKGVYRKVERFNSIAITRYKNASDGFYMQLTVDGVAQGKWFASTQLTGEQVLEFDKATIVVDASVWAGDFYITIPLKANVITFTPLLVQDSIEVNKTDVDNQIGILSEKLNLIEHFPVNNDLKRDGVNKLPIGTTIQGEYGSSNAIYTIPLPNFDVLHFSAKYRMREALPVVSYATVIQIGNERIQFTKTGGTQSYGYLTNRIAIGTNWSSYLLTSSKEHCYAGDVAFALRYVGEASEATMNIQNKVITISVDSAVVSSIALNDSVTIDELITSLKGVQDIEVVGYYTANKTCKDLFRDNITVNLIDTIAKDDGSGDMTDAPYIVFPYGYDTREHTIEFVIDKTLETPKTFVAFDGITYVANTNAIEAGSNLVLGNSSLPFTFYDLHIGLDSYEDAEVVTHYILGEKQQLISDLNPKLIIWEGHGVDDCLESESPTSDDMAASTDRLLCVFDALQAKGYVPITWQEVIEWKLSNRKIPKRSYCIMMDDFRVGNYVDYAKRRPFEKYNVKAGLAIIEDFSRDDVIEIDGQSYTKGQCVDMCMRAGWFLSSHAKHNRLGSYLPSALPSLLKDCAQSCDNVGIYSNVMIYPYGSFEHTIASMSMSDFILGVMTEVAQYNSRGSSDFYLGRCEIGVREELENVLQNIV